MAKKVSPLSRLNLAGKLGICAFLVAITALVYIFVFHNEIRTRISQTKTQSKELYRKLESAREAQHAYAKDLEELTEREQRQRELSKILPKTREDSAFLSSVQGVLDVTGVELLEWTPQGDAPQKFYARAPVNMQLKGRFHQLARLFYNIGQLDRIINIENISIKDPVEIDGDIKLTVSARATAFHQVAPTAAPAAGPPKRGRK